VHNGSSLNMLNLLVKNCSIGILLFCSMFPYLKTSHISSDVQPHVFLIFAVFACIAFIVSWRSFWSIFLILLGVLFVCLTAALEGGIDDHIRVGFFFLMIYVFLVIVPSNQKLVYEVVVASVVIYFLGLVTQLFFGIGVLDHLVSNLRFSDTRGFTSFASEPSFLGLISLCQLLLLEVLPGKRSRYVQLLAFFNLLLCASMTVILPALVILFFYLVFHKRRYSIGLLLIFLIISSVLVLKGGYGHLRLFMLIDGLLVDPMGLLSKDISAMNRLIRSFGPLYLAYLDGFNVHFFNVMENDLERIVFLWGGASELEITRLSNAATYLVYPFGWFGLILLVTYLLFLLCSTAPLYFKLAVVFYLLSNISIITPYSVLLFSISLQPIRYYGLASKE
jgi:hypothetical protein